MFYSKIEKILKEQIAGDEELLSKTKDKFHAIEREIDTMVNKKDPDLDKVFARLKILLQRLFGEIWVSKNWREIEEDIKYNLRELK